MFYICYFNSLFNCVLVLEQFEEQLVRDIDVYCHLEQFISFIVTTRLIVGGTPGKLYNVLTGDTTIYE
jgi:hypothetical protein